MLIELHDVASAFHSFWVIPGMLIFSRGFLAWSSASDVVSWLSSSSSPWVIICPAQKETGDNLCLSYILDYHGIYIYIFFKRYILDYHGI